MTAIRMDTDELKRLTRRIELEVSEPLCDVRRRVEGMLDRTQMCRQASEEFFRLSTPILRKAAASIGPSISHLQGAREKITLAVKVFEEMDNASAGRQAALRGEFPDWFWNRDFALCLIMDMTLGELTVFFPYGNLLGGNPEDFLAQCVSVLQSEIDDVRPGSQAASAFLSYSDITNIKSGTPEAEIYVLARDPAEILPGSPEEEVYIECIEEAYAVKFEGNWPKGLRLMVAAGIKDVGTAYGEQLNKPGPQAFRDVYGTNEKDHLFIIWGRSLPKGSGAIGEGNYLNDTGATLSHGGCTTNKHLINYVSISNLTANGSIVGQEDDTPEMVENKLRNFREKFQNGRNTSIHELGHAFCHVWTKPEGGYLPQRPDNFQNIEYPQRLLLLSDMGFLGHKPDCQRITLWRQHPPCSWDPDPASGEYFADMFLGWVSDTWAEPGSPEDGNGMGKIRQDFMNGHMSAWLEEAKLQPGLHASDS